MWQDPNRKKMSDPKVLEDTVMENPAQTNPHAMTRPQARRRQRLRFAPLLLALLLLSLVGVVKADGNSITTPDPGIIIGSYTRLVLDSSGNPVISYYDFSTATLKVLHCNDPNCAGNDESITLPATSVVGDTPLVLDSNGYPVILYRANPGGLRVVHCNDVNCAGNDESITAPDAEIFTAVHSDLVLDSTGNPILVYSAFLTGELRVMHCNDPNCAGGDDSYTSLDALNIFAAYAGISLELDSSGNPVISYYDPSNADLKVMHCNDPACTGGDESIIAADTGDDVGNNSSLKLDSSGNPVVSYTDNTNSTVKLMHCNDPDCTGNDESITSPDPGSSSGWFTSLMLDSDGNPVVSYFSSGLKVLHCNDANCSGNDESIVSADFGASNGLYTSLALDSSGNPVISYYDQQGPNLKVLHCGNPTCADTTSVSLAQVGTAVPTLPGLWLGVLLLLVLTSGTLLATRRRRAAS